MLVIRVTNKRSGGQGHYVGRPSPLGNPTACAILILALGVPGGPGF